MSFMNCSRASIKGKNTLNHIEGNQINGTVHGNVILNTGQAEVKHTKYNQFREVILGDVILEKEVHSSDLWKWKRKHGKWHTSKARQTIYTVEIVDWKTKFTAVTYEGKDAQRVWEEDFDEFSHTKKLGLIQLFGINQSSIPMLIFHDELIPLGHFYKLSFCSSLYLSYLRVNNGWMLNNVWMDARGSLCSGPEGPYAGWHGPWTDNSLIVPLEAKMLKDNISFRFFHEIGSSVDFSVLEFAFRCYRHIYLDDLVPWTAEDLQSKNPNNSEYPYLRKLWRNPPNHLPMNVIGGLRFDTLYSPSIEAVARWPKGAGSLWKWNQSQKYQSGLVDKTTIDRGLTRFTLDLTLGLNVSLEAYFLDWNQWHAWFSQSSWVFNALNVTEGEENFFFILPPFLTIESTLHEYNGLTAFFNLCDGKPPVEEALPIPSPIYLFLHPPPESILELALWRHQPYFWSFDKTGKSEMSEVECERWGVPVLTCRIHWWPSTTVQHWPTYVYTALRDWQEARGFDPTTSDWARSMGYPEFEIVGVRKNQGQFEEVDIQEEKTGSSLWEAFAGSGISACGF